VSDIGAVVQGGVSSTSVVRQGIWQLGLLKHPRAPEGLHGLVLAAPERPERADLPKYDRAALLNIEGEKLILTQGDGAIIRIQLSVAWLFAQQQTFNLEKQQMCFRQSESFVFFEGAYTSIFKQEDEIIGTIPAQCRPGGGRRSYQSVCFYDGHIYVLCFTVDGETGRILARQSHVQGRARDGHNYPVHRRKLPELVAPMSSVRFVVKPGTTLELLAGARPPKQFAARKQLAYLGLQDTDAGVSRCSFDPQ